MSGVEIIGGALSTYVRAVRVVCEEKAIRYEHKLARPHEPDVAAIHPFGKIPVMRHGDFECASRRRSPPISTLFSRVHAYFRANLATPRSQSSGYRLSTRDATEP